MKILEEDKLYIYKRDDKKCYFCKKPLELNQITLDHYLPKSHKGTTDVFNLVVCCKRCNKLKGNRVPDNYMDKILELFFRAVNDNIIKGCNLKISQKVLKQELLKINKIEAINLYFVLQSNELRFYLKNNKVVKMVYVHTNEQPLNIRANSGDYINSIKYSEGEIYMNTKKKQKLINNSDPLLQNVKSDVDEFDIEDEYFSQLRAESDGEDFK